MEEAFDPYEHWLGIPPAEQPPNHYRLLGLRRAESDLALVDRAYQLRMDHVQLCDDGTYPEAAMRLREHLIEARRVLFDPEPKRQYDATLEPPDERPPGASTPPIAGPIPSAPPRDLKGPSSGAKAWLSWFISLVLALVVAVPILLFLISRIDSAAPQSPAGSGDAAHSEQDNRHAGRSPASPDADPPDELPPSAARPPRLRGPRTMADLMAAADDGAADPASVTGLLEASMRAMSGRDFATAGDHVEAAVGLARSPTEQASAERIEALYRSAKAFWDAVETEASRLRGGEELPVGDTRVMVVEAGGGELLIRMLGENRRYAVEDLPWQLALPLAEPALPRDAKAMHLAIGSFLAVDGRADRQQALEHLELAGPEGRELIDELSLSQAGE